MLTLIYEMTLVSPRTKKLIFLSGLQMTICEKQSKIVLNPGNVLKKEIGLGKKSELCRLGVKKNGHVIRLEQEQIGGTSHTECC